MLSSGNLPPTVSAPAPLTAPTSDLFLDGQLKIRQQSKGHRIGTDAMLLAASLDVEQGLALDVGAGVGAVGLACALKRPLLRVGLLEYDKEVADLAALNIKDNHLEPRVQLYQLDVCDPAQRRAQGLKDVKADVIITNPPFFEAHQMRVSSDPQKRKAHAFMSDHSLGAPAQRGLDEWMRACVALSGPNARLVMIHRADALPALLQAAKGRFGGLEIMPVFSRPDRPAIRVLVRGRLGSRAPISLHPPLVLHDADGAFTQHARAINEGRISVPFLPSDQRN